MHCPLASITVMARAAFKKLFPVPWARLQRYTLANNQQIHWGQSQSEQVAVDTLTRRMSHDIGSRSMVFGGSDTLMLCCRSCLLMMKSCLGCREQVLARKRQEYRDMVPEYYDIASSERSEDDLGALRQVAVDVPRTAPGVAFFHEPAVQKCLERILYLWGVR